MPWLVLLSLQEVPKEKEVQQVHQQQQQQEDEGDEKALEELVADVPVSGGVRWLKLGSAAFQVLACFTYPLLECCGSWY
jgi:hypothetical protein